MSTCKKIALIRSSYSPYGGVERVALSSIRGLLEADANVTLLTWPNQKWPIRHKYLTIVPLGTNRGNRMWQAWRFNRSVNKYLSIHPFDCIFSLDRVFQFTHLHAGGGTHKTFLKIKNDNDTAIRRIFRKFSIFHAYILYLEKKSFSNPRLKKIRCNSSLVVNNFLKDYQVDRNKLHLIYSSIDWKNIGVAFKQRSLIAKEFYRTYNLNPQLSYLLFLGSGFSRKGLDIVIKGLLILPEYYHLLIVGKGAQHVYKRQAFKLGIDDRIHFLGAQEKGWQYSAICKALVLPSRYDPFGGAAAEAQAMGLPVLVSDKTGYSDMVLEGENGVILQSPMTEDTIKRAFIELIQMIEKPKMTADQIREHCKILDNNVISKQIVKEFLEI